MPCWLVVNQDQDQSSQGQRSYATAHLKGPDEVVPSATGDAFGMSAIRIPKEQGLFGLSDRLQSDRSDNHYLGRPPMFQIHA